MTRSPNMTSRRRWRRAAWAAFAVALAVGLLWLCFRHVDIDRLKEILRSANVPLLGCAAICVLLVVPIAAFEWKLLLPPTRSAPFAVLLRTQATMVTVQNSIHHFAGQ